jgi:hypothetical protein
MDSSVIDDEDPSNVPHVREAFRDRLDGPVDHAVLLMAVLPKDVGSCSRRSYRGEAMIIKRYINPNGLARLAPVRFEDDGEGVARLPVVEIERVLEAAGFTPDDEDEAVLDLGALSDDGITL